MNLRKRLRRWFGGGTWFACWTVWILMISTTISAQSPLPSYRKVVVADFRGPGAEVIRSHVVRALEQQANIGTVATRRRRNAGSLRAFAQRRGAVAIISGRIVRASSWLVTIKMRSLNADRFETRIPFSFSTPYEIRTRLPEYLSFGYLRCSCSIFSGS